MTDEHTVEEISSLYRDLIQAWNAHDAGAFGALFAPDGTSIGFDGSIMDGGEEIRSQLEAIFADHEPARYVTKIREVRLLADGVGMLRAIAGMVPPGGSDIEPGVNALQTFVAVRGEGRWEIALFQNTPAAFHGRPEMAEQMTEELREVLRST